MPNALPFLAVVLLALTACASGPDPGPDADAAPGPRAMPEPVAAVAARLDARSAARNFVQVVEQVEPVAEAECRARAPRLNCDFNIVVDDRPGQPPNAFQTEDAFGRPIIAFTLGLIGEARNADELAFVMAHEAGHHIAGHLEQQRLNATTGALVFGELAGVFGQTSAQELRAAREIGAVVGARSYSKAFELEADRLGTIIAARAGYDPLRGAGFFFRIPDPEGMFLSTHPPNAERLAMVRNTAAGLGN